MSAERGQEECVLRVEHVGKTYENGKTVLTDINFSVKAGETVAIIGPSGAGKTTLLRCINFLEPYTTGKITVNGKLVGYRESDGKLVRDKPSHLNCVRSHIGFVFQKYNLFPHLTVMGNLLEGPVHSLKIPEGVAAQRARQELERVGLVGKETSYPHELSGGEQQRVGIARALCMDPKVMLFDEATASLDPERVTEVLKVMQDLVKDGMTMVVVTHELNFARRSADRVIFMEQGKISVDSSSKEFFDSPPTTRVSDYLRHLSPRW